MSSVPKIFSKTVRNLRKIRDVEIYSWLAVFPRCGVKVLAGQQWPISAILMGEAESGAEQILQQCACQAGRNLRGVASSKCMLYFINPSISGLPGKTRKLAKNGLTKFPSFL